MCSVRAAFFSRFRNAIIWFVLRLCADTGMPAQHDTLRDGLSFTPPC